MKTQILAIIILISCSAFAFDYMPDRTPKKYGYTNDNDRRSVVSDFHPNFVTHNYEPVKGATLIYFFQPMGVTTVYDIQSNASPNEIWQDPFTPLNVHATFMFSTVSDFETRDCAYLFSNDGGVTWTNLGNVPSSGRSGFPSITGLPSGAAVIANQNTTNGTTARTKINYDAGAGFGVYTEIDPGLLLGVDALWPRVISSGSNSLVFASFNYGKSIASINTATSIAPPGSFNGYVAYPGDGAESYSLSISPNGRVGHAYIGYGADAHDAFYRNSMDGGLTWSIPEKIWNWISKDSLGALCGISLVYGNNNEPYVTFEICYVSISGFYPGLNSSIRVWSPTINGGIPKIIADKNNIPFFPNKGNVSDGFLPICRPVIGRSYSLGAIFVAFNATTGNYGSDSSAYYAAWLAYSGNNGISWSDPERMTPTSPLRDWRYVSISQVNNVSGGIPVIQMMCQDDSLPGAYVNGSPISNAQGMGIVGTFFVPGILPHQSKKTSLLTNFPNPFNPSTSIRFDITKQTNVTLKVYNSNGQEVETLVDNETVTPGTKEVFFDGNNLSSGIYFYTIIAGEFKETKKMILLK